MFKSKEFRRLAMSLIIANSIFSTGLLEYFLHETTQVIGSVYSITAVIIYCAAFYFFVDELSLMWKNRQTDMSAVMTHFQFVHNAFMYLLTVVAGFLRRKQIRLSVAQLEKCARAIGELGIPDSYSIDSNHKYFPGPVLFMWILGVIITELMWFKTYHTRYTVILLYCIVDTLPPIALFIVDFTFVYWIRYAKIKFRQLNVLLRSMLTTTTDLPQHRRVLRMRDKWKDTYPSSTIHGNYKVGENISKLRRVKEIHLELTKCARSINQAYGLHVLMSMARIFVILTALLYTNYDNLVRQEFFLGSNHFFIYIFWFVFLGLDMLAVNHACATTTIEVRNFTQQLLQNPLTFTACGFFNLDYTFIYSMIGSITTYLVILIQVGNGSETKMANVVHNATYMV